VNEDPSRLRDLLGSFGARRGIKDPAQTGLVWARWEEIVGSGIAAHCRPSSLRDGLLRLRADAPAWATEVGYLAEEIRRKVNLAAQSELVKEIRVWVAPLGEQAPAGVSNTRRSGPRPEDQKAVPRDRSGDPREGLARAREAWARRAGKRSS
jgi:predicted nucleic acid-binding Zn ribbon protein